jgi:hypothetical protein
VGSFPLARGTTTGVNFLPRLLQAPESITRKENRRARCSCERWESCIYILRSMDFNFSCVLECLTQALNSTLVMQLTRLLPFGFAITCASLAAPAPAPEPTALAVLPRTRSNEYTNYTTLTGFFLQDDPATSTTGFDYVRMQFWRARARAREDVADLYV